MASICMAAITDDLTGAHVTIEICGYQRPNSLPGTVDLLGQCG